MMRALNEISLSRTTKPEDLFGRQAEATNNNRLNQNFRMLQAAVNALELVIEDIDALITSKLPVQAALVSDLDSDGVWSWRVWDDGLIEARVITVAASINCNTASGSTYVAEVTIALPTDLFTTIENVLVTPICSGNYIAASVKSITASTLVLRIICTVSASISAQFGILVIGK